MAWGENRLQDNLMDREVGVRSFVQIILLWKYIFNPLLHECDKKSIRRTVLTDTNNSNSFSVVSVVYLPCVNNTELGV